MKFFTLVAALAAAVPAVLAQLTINTPASVVECEPTQFSWSGGTAPYYLTLVPAGQPSAPAIKQFPTQTGTSYTWTVDLQSGTSVTISLKDSTGATAYSDIVTISAGTSTSCVNTSVQETGGSGSGSAPSTPSSGSTSPATTAAGSSPAGTSAAGSPAGSSAAPTSTTTAGSAAQSNAASSLSFSSAFGVAGIMGLVGAALF